MNSMAQALLTVIKEYSDFIEGTEDDDEFHRELDIIVKRYEEECARDLKLLNKVIEGGLNEL